MEHRKYFEAQQDNEEIILVIRKHWFVLFPSFVGVGILYLIGLSLIFVLPYLKPEIVGGFSFNIYVLVLSLLFLVTTNVLFSAILIYYLNVGLVTNEHIVEIVQERLFARKVSELELGKIQDVSSDQKGIMRTILNFGQVEIQTAGEMPNFIFVDIPDPAGFAQRIMDLAEEFAKKHGHSTLGEKMSAKAPAESEQENS